LALLASLLTTAVTLLQARLVQELVDTALLGDARLFTVPLSLLAIVIVASLVLAYVRPYAAAAFSERALLDLREKLGHRLLATRYAEVERLAGGDALSRLSNDLDRIKVLLSSELPDVVFRPVLAAAAFVYLMHINPWLTLLTVAIMPAAMLAAGRLSRPLGEIGRQVQEHLGRVVGIARETLSGIETVRAYRMERSCATRHRDAVEALVRSSFSMMRRISVLYGLSGTLSVLPFLVCFGVGGFWVIRAQLTLGQLFAFVSLLNHLTFPLSALPPLLGEIRGSYGALERAAALAELPVAKETGTIHSAAPADPPVLALTSVSFQHPAKAEAALNDVSLHLTAGERVLLVGPSGGGKSTIIKVAAGLYAPAQGQVELLGHNIGQWHPQALRQHLVVVEQRPFIFRASVEENITCGLTEHTRDEVVRAVELAGAGSFVTGLPAGLDTPVGEQGESISGGQRQLIALSRAMLRVLRGAHILMLDEAFSSLPLAEEIAFMERLRDGVPRPLAVLMVTHRVAAAPLADRVVMVSGGTILATGTHDQLLASEPSYRSLFLAQDTTTNRGGAVA
jgi:ABC-type bacteriocin/lantibiotic exporter with double-glycine peptidase domain